jgi:hypothetical protein
MSTWKVRLFFVAVFGFLYSAYLAAGELNYALWGKAAQARLLGVSQARDIGVSGRSSAAVAYEYSFYDEGLGQRTETDLAPPDWTGPRGEMIAVQYIPGSTNKSRLAGHRETWAVVFFFGLLAVLVAFVWRLIREANEPYSGPHVKWPTG